MTGQYAPRTGLYTVGTSERGEDEERRLVPPKNQTELPLDRKTVADVLKGAGYATGIFGKWHLGGGDAHHASKRGFDEAITAQGDHFNFKTAPPTTYPEGQHYADFLTDRAVDFIARHKEKPFLLYLPHFAVHSPIDPKPEYAKRWREKAPKGTHWNPEYAALLQSLDESVGRVMEALAEHGLAENTLVVFSSDNGGVGGYHRSEPNAKANPKRRGNTDNAPLRGGKGTLYEGGVRVPFLVRWPGVAPAGSVCNAPIAHVDLLPTLAEAARTSLPSQTVDGASIVPLLRDPTATLARDALYLHFPVYLESYVNPEGWRTTPGGYVMAGDWKLISYYEGQRVELYNLADDPGETKEMSQAEPQRATALLQQLERWRTGIGAAAPTPKP
jgi:arylsulfatase A-like enzyme